TQLQPSPSTPTRRGAATSDGVWMRDTLQREQWLVPLPAECWQELEAAIDATAGLATPVHELSADDFELTNTRAFAAKLRRDHLDSGPMFAVVDRFPVERFDKEALTRAYW